MRVLVSNYDPKWRHSEVFPVTFTGLSNGKYRVIEKYLSGRVVDVPVEVVNGQLRREYSLSPNEVVLVEVKK